MDNLRYSIGREGFIWWMGVVEDRNDPDQLGRVRVRCFGWHTEDKTLIPTDALPWAHPVHSVNVPSSYTPKEGDWCVGFFADGDSAQQPVILGCLTGSPVEAAKRELGFHDPSGVYPKRINESTMNRLIRGRADGTIHETRKRTLKKGVKSIGVTWNEPAPTFAPQYPLNFSIESESGHAFELDDTAGVERVNLAHKNGSFIEMDASGNRVEKITKDKYTIVAGSDYVVIDGMCNITVKGNANLKVGGRLSAEAKTINLNASGDVKIKAGGSLKMEAVKGVDIKSTLAVKIGAGSKLSLKGKTTAITGKPLTLGGKVANIVKTPNGPGKIIPMGTASPPSGTGLASVASLTAALPTVPSVADVVSSATGSLPAVPSVASLTGSVALPTLPSFSGVLPSIPSLPAIPSVVTNLPSMPSLPSVPSMASVGPLPSLPKLPSLPSVPSLPQLPSVPKLPELAVLREASLPHLPTIPTFQTRG